MSAGREMELTDEQLKLLRNIVSYALSNVDDVNDAFDADYSETDIKQLQGALDGNLTKEKSATLLVDVVYDPTATDADEICEAFDTLIETALNTPGSLIKGIGEFYVEDA